MLKLMNLTEFLDELIVFCDEATIALIYANTVLDNISLPYNTRKEIKTLFINLEAIRYFYDGILNTDVLNDNSFIQKMKNASARFRNDEYALHQFLTTLDEVFLLHGNGPAFKKNKLACKQPLET